MASLTEKTKNVLPADFFFRGKWRSYQQNFLDDISVHIDDKKLNVVAAPGAGKTTLGLEILKRLNKPALILAPTITIKNQWKQRILEGFLSPESNTNWVSTNIKNISVVTSTTYQAAHTLLKNPDYADLFIAELKNHGVKTLVLDEAHHLRTEWYHSLDYLCRKLDAQDFTVVSLTATPPYDVSQSEWNNYHSLCGPVDAEISIPELVKNGDLCVHQDLIWFSDLSAEEKKCVFDYEKNRHDFFEYIKNEADFSYSIKTSAFVADYENNIELIYDDTDFTISVISYLLYLDDLSIEAKILTEFLAVPKESIPKFDYSVAEILLNGFWGKYKKHFKNVPLIKGKLKEYGLLKSSTSVDLKGEVDLKKLYARSVNKLDAVLDITLLENKLLGQNLREVVLLDYIGGKNLLALNVLSVFDKLINSVSQSVKCGILTGSVVVIPQSAEEILYKLVEKYKIDKKNVLTSAFDANHIRVETYGSVSIVPVITKLFSLGEINILVGTQSLLGEGWDAPCINSLIIASTVGSFMLSNQIRGRALRIDRNCPKKAANIWHLVSLSQGDASTDLDIVEKRFNTFEGISFVDDKIQNGIFRLGYDSEKIDSADCKSLNDYSSKKAEERAFLFDKWKQVFDESELIESKIRPQVYETIQTQDFKLPDIFYHDSRNSLYKVFRNIFGKAYVYFTQKDFNAIATALLKSMCKTGIILTPYENIQVINKIGFDCNTKTSSHFLTVLNCSNYERNLFVKTLNEMFTPPKKQRYILRKTDPKTKQVKYLCVPEIIASKKKKVTVLEKNLEPVLGYMEIIFTKTPEGRKELLKARFNALELAKLKQGKIWI